MEVDGLRPSEIFPAGRADRVGMADGGLGATSGSMVPVGRLGAFGTHSIDPAVPMVPSS
jgi:hypothetical protein